MTTAVEYRPAGSLGNLLCKNAALNVVTLSIYRFWGKTAVRRYFWQAVRLDGDPFEYTGLGRELFIGFLIVLAILAPITMMWGALETTISGEPLAQAASKAAYVLIFFVLIQAARYRARRYRLSRTRWRGIRAGQDGSTWRYIGLSLGWGLLSLVTLGIGFPWMRTILQRYRTTNTRLGDQYFTFDAPALPLLPRWLVVLSAAALPYAGASYVMWRLISPAITESGLDETVLRENFAAAASGSFGLGFLAVAAGGLTYVWYRAAEFRHYAAHTQLGEIQFQSELRAGVPLARVVGAAVAIVAVAIGAMLILMLAGFLIAILGGGLVVANLVMVPIFFGAYVAATLLWTSIVTVGVLRHLCETLAISTLEPLGKIAQSAAPEPAYGEGLADSFEVAG